MSVSPRRIPVIPTLLVLVAVAVMVRLGFWQLDRLHQKEVLLTQYAAAADNLDEVAFPSDRKSAQAVLYRRSQVVCRDYSPDSPDEPIAGRNASGVVGWAHVYRCRQFRGPDALVVLGWSSDPRPRVFRGGRYKGVIGPGPRLIVIDPQQSAGRGLQANAKPDPASVPNNHLSYAVQWFLFALTALVIYAIALRKRLAA